MTAALIIFCEYSRLPPHYLVSFGPPPRFYIDNMLSIGSGAGTSAFVPVMSEMRKPEDYNKAVYSCMSWVTVCYLTYV